MKEETRGIASFLLCYGGLSGAEEALECVVLRECVLLAWAQSWQRPRPWTHEKVAKLLPHLNHAWSWQSLLLVQVQKPAVASFSSHTETKLTPLHCTVPKKQAELTDCPPSEWTLPRDHSYLVHVPVLSSFFISHSSSQGSGIQAMWSQQWLSWCAPRITIHQHTLTPVFIFLSHTLLCMSHT